MNESQCDVAIIGGGIAGLTVAYRLRQQSPHLRVALLEASDRQYCHRCGPIGLVASCGGRQEVVHGRRISPQAAATSVAMA